MNTFDKYYDKLNAAQKKAVDIIDGPLLILAGPGTGKTELLSVRASNIIRQKKANPENILILTYTNAAAKAMKERLVKILGEAGYDVETATFHSFANSIILESEEAANYVQDKVQMEEIEEVRLLEYILDHTDGIDAVRPPRAPYTYRYHIGRAISDLKKEGVTPDEFIKYSKDFKADGIYIEDKHIPRLKALADVYKLYEHYKEGKNRDIFDERGRYNFDDMIILATEALKKEKTLNEKIHNEYTHIMVDEFQDTNGSQMRFLFELINPKRPNICCVGDDDQSIFRFQGASVVNFRLLKEKFPNIAEVSLKDNYRSTKEIISLSEKIIQRLPAKERVFEKELLPKKEYRDKSIEFYEFTTETAELLFITEKVKEIKKIVESSAELSEEEKRSPYNNIAVLVRKRDDILKVVDAFLKAGIPYATDGKEDITSEKRVRQMLDVLTLAHFKDTTDYTGKETVFYRVITSDYFKIDFTDILKFISYVKSKKEAERDKINSDRISLFYEFLNLFGDKDEKGTQGEIIKKIGLKDEDKLIRAGCAIKNLLKDAETRPVHSMLIQYINEAGVYKYILESYNNNAILGIRDLRALSSFVNMVKRTNLARPSIRLSDFLGEVETRETHNMPLVGSLVTATQEGVRVLTAHSSKGLEFHTVIVPFCLEKKNWPMAPPDNLIPLPPAIYKRKPEIKDKKAVKALSFYDETRLFYVATTRAKSTVIYTASPTESAINSSYIADMGLDKKEPERLIKEAEMLKASLKETFAEDTFNGTENILRDMVSNLTLNPTSVNTYIKCRRKFLYNNILRLSSEKRAVLVFGNCVHKALEDTYRYFMAHNKFPKFEFFKTSFARELDFQGVDDSIRTECLRWFGPLKKWFELERKAPVMPIALEAKLRVTLTDDLIFTGKFDKTEYEDEKKSLVRVIDYKTGAPDKHVKRIDKDYGLSNPECDEYLRQLVAYKLLFEKEKENKGKIVTTGVLVFTAPAKGTAARSGLIKGEYINKAVELTDPMVSELEGVIRDCWGNIKSLCFEKLPERDKDMDKCGGCDYDSICWG